MTILPLFKERTYVAACGFIYMSCSLLEGFYCGLKVVAACQDGHSRSVRIVVTEAGTIWFVKFFTRNRVSEGKKEKANEKGTLWWLLALELFVYKGTRFLQLPALMTHVSGLQLPSVGLTSKRTSVTQHFCSLPVHANVTACNSTECECKGVARNCVSVVRTLVRPVVPLNRLPYQTNCVFSASSVRMIETRLWERFAGRSAFRAAVCFSSESASPPPPFTSHAANYFLSLFAAAWIARIYGLVYIAYFFPSVL